MIELHTSPQPLYIDLDALASVTKGWQAYLLLHAVTLYSYAASLVISPA